MSVLLGLQLSCCLVLIQPSVNNINEFFEYVSLYFALFVI